MPNKEKDESRLPKVGAEVKQDTKMQQELVIGHSMSGQTC